MTGYPRPDWQHHDGQYADDRHYQGENRYGAGERASGRDRRERRPRRGASEYGATYGDQPAASESASPARERRARSRDERYGYPRSGSQRPGGERGQRQRPGSARPGSQRPARGRTRNAQLDEPAEPESKRPRRRLTPLWAKLTVAAGATLMLFSGTAIAGYEVLSNRYTSNVQQENLLGDAAVATGETLDGPLNILLLGVDARTPDSEDDVRSDTIIVLHVPSTHDQAYLMSVPRDTWVTVPGYWDMKITEAFYYGYQDIGGWEGGTQLIAQTMNQMTGLSFNGAAIINFSGFQRVIDEMGGIEFCVEVAATSEHLVLVDGERMSISRARREGLYYEPVRYEVGCQLLQGWQALDYVRQRKQLETEEGDYARQRHQQQLLQAMVDQATSTDVRTNLGILDRLVLAAGEAVIVDTNNVDMIDFLFTMRNIRPGDLVSLQTNEGWYNPVEIDGVSAELLSPESLEMFRAAANDTMGQFVLQHPDYVNAG